MKRIILVAAGAGAGVLLALAEGVMTAPKDTAWPSRFFFPPDLWGVLTGIGRHSAATISGASAGALLGAAAGNRRVSVVVLMLMLLNPAMLCAVRLGPGALLYFMALLLLFMGVAQIMVRRDHLGAVWLGLTAGAAPFFSNSALVFYPVLLAALPILTPWGAGPRKLAGFAVVAGAPLALASLAMLYLTWLYDAPLPAESGDWRAAFAPQGLFLAAGAALIATAAQARRQRLAQGAAIVASGGLFWAFRDSLASLL